MNEVQNKVVAAIMQKAIYSNTLVTNSVLQLLRQPSDQSIARQTNHLGSKLMIAITILATVMKFL
jgi:hypothetical protein